jgi:hypothetical protein
MKKSLESSKRHRSRQPRAPARSPNSRRQLYQSLRQSPRPRQKSPPSSKSPSTKRHPSQLHGHAKRQLRRLPPPRRSNSQSSRRPSPPSQPSQHPVRAKQQYPKPQPQHLSLHHGLHAAAMPPQFHKTRLSRRRHASLRRRLLPLSRLPPSQRPLLSPGLSQSQLRSLCQSQWRSLCQSQLRSIC